MNKLFMLLGIFFLTYSNTFANQNDVSISHKDVGGGCLTTVDIRMTESIANQDDLVIDYNYQSIKEDGITMNVFYAQALGKAQWTPFTSMRGIYIMRSSILLPTQQWIKDGMPTNGNFWVRVVLMKPSSCNG